MTQGYGNQESAADTKAAKRDPKDGSADKDGAPAPKDRKDVATTGDGAGPDGAQGKDVDPGVG